MLGWDLAKALKGSGYELLEFDRQHLDITDRTRVFSTVLEHKPSVVINAAAYTNVDLAESERDQALAINAMAPGYLAEACSEIVATFVHFSTDQVFDGSGETPWEEEDKPNPSNYYAYTKWLGEQTALKYSASLILRVQWLYGEHKERFTALKNKEVFTPFADQWGAPTWTKHVAESVLRLLEKRASGLFHFAYDDWATWYDVFQFVCQKLGYRTQLVPKKIADVHLPASRPRFCVLSNRKLASTLGMSGMGRWKVALGEFLSKL
ncbi:MAG: dTDP-4-dehydrorhamnose reductase [Deltaproteobacteria bacterium]|nr:dTDP-4-dehydrorhamnose reductase [Deltaproteobacteria bacterium]